VTVGGDYLSVPHPPLKPYYEHEADRRTWVLDIFQRTAGDYDRIERMMALGTGSWYRRCALTAAGLRPDMTVLDIGAGTGLVTCEAVRIVGDPGRVIGVEGVYAWCHSSSGSAHGPQPQYADAHALLLGHDRDVLSSGIDSNCAPRCRI
jgi:hypothetical protein